MLPASPLSREELDAEKHYIIGVGLNYDAHRDEVGRGDEGAVTSALLFFPKSAAPVGAYGELAIGNRIDVTPPQPVSLLDYEIELALLTLADIDLASPLNEDQIYQNLAYMVANDYSDREPIILDDQYGYAQGKSREGYLPVGPWLVLAQDMPQLFTDQNYPGLTMSLQLRSGNAVTERQRSNTRVMLSNPYQILLALQHHYQSGTRLCMRDTLGEPRYLYSEQGRIPAGSLILTGTPEGVAIRVPAWYQKIELFLTGGFTVSGAREAYVEDLSEAEPSPFIRHGDQIYGQIVGLGQQQHLWVSLPSDETVMPRLIAPLDCSYTVNAE